MLLAKFVWQWPCKLSQALSPFWNLTVYMIPYIFIHGIRQFGAKLGSAPVLMALEKIFSVKMHFHFITIISPLKRACIPNSFEKNGPFFQKCFVQKLVEIEQLWFWKRHLHVWSSLVVNVFSLFCEKGRCPFVWTLLNLLKLKVYILYQVLVKNGQVVL